MEKAFKNTANYIMIEWCEAHNVDCSGTVITNRKYNKQTDSYSYNLVKGEFGLNEDGRSVLKPTDNIICYMYFFKNKSPVIIPSMDTRKKYPNERFDIKCGIKI